MKKRFLSVLTTIVLLTIIGICAVTNAAALAIGDVDNDNDITAADARLILRTSVGLETLSEEESKAADVDNDGDITAADARLVLRVSVDLETLHEHAYASSVTKKATCTEKGVKTFTCDCGESYTEEIAATGHTKVAMKAVSATCTKSGLTEGEKCSACDEVFVEQKTTAALGHTGGSATCSTKAKCTRCGEYYGSLNANNHESIVTDKAVAATCTKTGLTEGTHCSKCNKVIKAQTIVAKKAHTEQKVSAVAATCTKTGLTEGKKCSVCGEILVAQTQTKALGHKYTSVVTPPSCTKKGYTTYTCSVCGDSYTSDDSAQVPHTGGTATCTTKAVCSVCGVSYGELNPDNHINKQTKEAQDATCTEKGYEAGTYCNDCKTWISGHGEIAALGHDEEQHDAKEATCTEDGWKAYVTCSRCDYTTYEKIDALGHDEEQHDAKEATCTEDGWKAYVTCSRCDYTTYEKIDALGHDEVSHDGKAATCTEKGWEAYVTCSRCDYTTYKEIAALGHSYGTLVAEVAATCTKTGTKAHYTCSVCKKNFDSTKNEITDLVIAIDASNHVNTKDEAKVSATCSEKGYEAGTYCNDCKTWISGHGEIAALGHDEEQHDAKEATCTEDGWKAYVTCSRCDYTTKEVIKAGHIEVQHAAQAATCTDIGWNAYVTCSRCDYTTYKEIAALGHSYGTLVAEVAATCTKTGTKAHYTCSVCKKNFDSTKNEITDLVIAIDASNHVNTKDEEKVSATCTEKGYEAGTYCNDCKTWISGHKEIPTTTHTMEGKVVPPSCTQGGYTVDTCTVCGHIDASTACNHTSPTGHSWGSVKTVAPTCEEDGYDVQKCTVCEAEERTDYVDKLGHDYTYTTNKAANCKETGSRTGVCKTCGNTVDEIIPLTACTDTKTEKVAGSGDTYCKTVVTCNVCGKTVSEKSSITSHKLKVTNQKVATCTEPRTATQECRNCNYKKENVILQAAKGHAVAASVMQAANCTEDGYAIYSGSCETCGKTLDAEKVIQKASGHTAVGNVTCTKAVTCSTCEAVLEPALGHDFNVNSKAYGKNITTFYCSRCGEQTDNPLSVFNGIVNSIKSVQYTNQYLNAQPGGNTLLNYIDKTSVDTEYTRFDFGIYTSAIKNLYEEEMAENADTYSKYIRSYSVKFALPLSGETNKSNAVSQLEQSDIDSIKVEKLTGIKFSEILSSITPADGDLANAEQVAKLNAIKNVEVNKNVVKVSVNVKDEKYSQIKNLPVDTKTSLQKIYDLDIRDELSEFDGTDKNGNPTITEVDKDDSIGYEVSMTMTLKEITSDALVTYYFDAETYEPIIALYGADIKMAQSIDMKFKISLFSLDGELDPIITTSYLRAYIFPNYIPQ